MGPSLWLRLRHGGLCLIVMLLLGTAFAFSQPVSSLTQPGISFLLDVTASYQNTPFKAHDAIKWRYLSVALFLPYDRGNIYLINPFNTSGAHLGEDYLTYNLGEGFLLKAGLFRANFGRENIYHIHQLSFTSHPLMYYRFFGEEGLKVNGLQISYLMPTSFYWEVGYERSFWGKGIFKGGYSTDLYSTWSFSPSDDSELSFGLSWTRGKGYASSLEAYDAYISYKWLPWGYRLYKELSVTAEYMQDDKGDRRGAYLEIGGKFGQRDVYWAYRYDFVKLWGTKEEYHSLSYTYMPSEFQKYRLQLSYNPRTGKLFPIIQLLLLFQIGQHPAHSW